MNDVIVGTLSKKLEYCEAFVGALARTHPYFDKKNVFVVDDTRLPLEELVAYPWANGITWIPSYRPWGFSKNANYLVQAALIKGTDLLLCNDDTEFMTPNGIYAFQQIVNNYPNIGLLSPVFVGGVGNTRQMAIRGQYKEGQVVVYEEEVLAFVAVYITNKALSKVGFLNELYDDTTYGWEDNDYCDRVKEAGLDLAITPIVKMHHGHQNKSFSCTYGDLVNIDLMTEKGKRIYKQEKQRRKTLASVSLGRLHG